MRRRLALLAAGLAAMAGCAIALTVIFLPINMPVLGMLIGSRTTFSDQSKIDARLELREGYRAAIFAVGLGSARALQIADDGSLLVSVPSEGAVKLVAPDRNGDGRADEARVLVDGLRRPHGLLLEGRALIVAEIDKLTQIIFDDGWRILERKTLLTGMPADGGHSTRTVARGRDRALYVAIGSSCNVCKEAHAWRAAIIRLAPGASTPEIFATGLRNTVGIDWQPGTGTLYGVDNGRDYLGDDFPPDELNRIEKGGFYGWPFFHGPNVPDPDLGGGARTLPPLPPAHAFGAHVAPLSIRFLTRQADPAMNGAALVAQHGSWNRSTKAGYRIVSLHWAEDGTITQKPFVTGFEKNGDVIGRPVDIVEASDGTIFVSDDFAGAIYRITGEPG